MILKYTQKDITTTAHEFHQTLLFRNTPYWFQSDKKKVIYQSKQSNYSLFQIFPEAWGALNTCPLNTLIFIKHHSLLHWYDILQKMYDQNINSCFSQYCQIFISTISLHLHTLT